MNKKKSVNPNVVRAKISGSWYDYEKDVNVIMAITDAAVVIILYVDEERFKKVKSNTKQVTLWRGMDSAYKYIAFGNYIVTTANQKNFDMDSATQKHFDEYKRKADARLMRARLDDIMKNIAVIKAINVKADADAEKAKKTLVGCLLAQAAVLRQDLTKRR